MLAHSLRCWTSVWDTVPTSPALAQPLLRVIILCLLESMGEGVAGEVS